MTFKNILFIYSESQRDEFKKGNLRKYWLEEYAQILGGSDEFWCPNQYQMGYCYYEMLAIIQLHISTGFIGYTHVMYSPKKYPEEKERLRQKFSPRLFKLAMYEYEDNFLGHKPSAPDLLLVAPDLSDYFFCEVKGYRDRISPQQDAYFKEIVEEAEGRFYICRFSPI